MKTGYQSSRFAHQVITFYINVTVIVFFCLCEEFDFMLSFNVGGEICMPVHEPGL